MKNWIKIILVVCGFAIVSVAIYLILKFAGIISFAHLKATIENSGSFGILIYFLLLVVLLVGLCFVPLLNTTLIILGIILFNPVVAFITNIVAIFFSSSILFFIGDKFGEKLAIKLIGKKAFEETQNLIDTKSKFILPVLFIIPGIPDESLCIMAGMTKMKYWYLILVSVVYHAIEIGLFCFFGSDIINWKSLTAFDWIIFVNLILIDFYLYSKFEKYLTNKHKNKLPKNSDQPNETDESEK